MLWRIQANPGARGRFAKAGQIKPQLLWQYDFPKECVLSKDTQPQTMGVHLIYFGNLVLPPLALFLFCQSFHDPKKICSVIFCSPGLASNWITLPVSSRTFVLKQRPGLSLYVWWCCMLSFLDRSCIRSAQYI